MSGPRRWDDHPFDCICPRCLRSSSKRRGAEALRRRLQADSGEHAQPTQPTSRKFLVWTAVTATVGLLSGLMAFALMVEPSRTEVREFFGFARPAVPTPSGPLPFQALVQARETPMPTVNYSIDDVDISLMPTETGAVAQLKVTVQNTSGSAISGPVAILLSVDSETPDVVDTILDLADGASEVYVFSHDLPPGQHTLTVTVGDASRDLTVDMTAIPVPSWQAVTTPTVSPATVSQSPTPVQQIVATPVLEPMETPVPTGFTTIPTWTSTPVVTSIPEPTATSVPPTPTVTPTPIPAVSLILDTDTTVVGYWQDGSADMQVDVSLWNTGGFGYHEDVSVKVNCPETLTDTPGCGEQFNLSLEDGYGPTTGSFIMKLPMGRHDIELGYGVDSMAVNIDVPERILSVEREVWECYADREATPDPWQPGAFLYGCSGWASPDVVKWLNDVPVKVWATGDPQYIETLDEVLEELSPVLSLDFTWVETEADADFRAFVGVKREDVDHLGFAPSSVDWGGFANANLSSGEARSGYMVVWLIEEERTDDAVRSITIHEALHALVPTHHTTRPVSIMGGGGLNKWSRRDEQLMRLNSHHLIRPGMTMHEVKDLIVFRDDLMDGLGPVKVTDPLEMVWRAYESLDDADYAGYKLTGGWIDRGCNQTFGVRRGPLEFKIGKFRKWRDDPALLYFHDHVNEFWLFWDEDWHRYMRPLTGGDWRSVSQDDLWDKTTWWVWNGKLHRAIRSVIADSSEGDFTVGTSEDGDIRLHVQMDESYVHMFNWDRGFESLDFTLDLHPDTYEITGYHWLHREDPGLDLDGCITYEEDATDLQVGVEVELPEELRND